MLVDVGGGSTELLIGECGETLAARSLKVGAVRLTDRFFPAARSPRALKDCRNHVRSLIEHFHREVTRHGFEVAVASSGTAETVARIARASGAEPLRTYNCFEVTGRRPRRRRRPTRQASHGRRPGEGARARGPAADIIVAGALILATIAETFDVGSFLYSEAALREGVLLDTMSRRRGGHRGPPPARRVAAQHPPTRRSLRRRSGALDPRRRLRRRSVRRHPELRASVLGPRVPRGRRLLANVGLVVAHSQHHLHAYYVIRNSELAGLTDSEIEVIAQIARYHRKSEPKQSHQPFAALSATISDSFARSPRAAGGDRTRPRHEGRVAGVGPPSDAEARSPSRCRHQAPTSASMITAGERRGCSSGSRPGRSRRIRRRG